MKEERGITLTSIIIYIVALLIVIGIVSSITSYFYRNINLEDKDEITNSQFTKFNSYFTSDINQEGIKIVEAGDNENVNYITFSNKTTYTFSKANKSIYMNEVKICENIDSCIFSSEENNQKYDITVNFKSGDFEKQIVYNTK